jgi:vacuolar-type H+-ATPase subunit H
MAKAQRSANASQADAEYRAAKAAADAENKAMSEKFKLDQAQYQQALKELPEIQKKAQQEYSANVVKNAEGISKAFPKDSKIFSSQFGTSDFIDESIQKSGIAGSREANQASRILKSIFPEGEILTGRELSARYKALEGAIQKATPEVREVLNEFKTHMGDRLPSILADNLAYTRIVPTLKMQVEREVASVLDAMQLSETGVASRPFLKSKANSNISQLFREMTPQEFMKKMQSGEIRQQILKGVMNPNDFSKIRRIQ